MGNLLPPPTFAPLLVDGPQGKQNAINPVWLQWFLQYAGSNQASYVNANNTTLPAALSLTYNTGTLGSLFDTWTGTYQPQRAMWVLYNGSATGLYWQRDLSATSPQYSISPMPPMIVMGPDDFVGPISTSTGIQFLSIPF